MTSGLIDCRKLANQEEEIKVRFISAELFRWERFLKRLVHERVTLSSAMSCQANSNDKTTIMLHEILPVLKNARLCNKGLQVQLVTHEDFRVDLAVSLETVRHGVVTVVGVSVDDDLMNRTQCNMRFGMSREGPLITMNNHGSPEERHLYYITMAVAYTGCTYCKEHASKLWKCCKCWDDLRFPVRYCCKGCQAADFPRHRRVCGVKGLET